MLCQKLDKEGLNIIHETMQFLIVNVDNLLEAIATTLPSAMQTCLRRNDQGRIVHGACHKKASIGLRSR